MERYHMFKLGLAVLFYAAYCIRPMMVSCLNTSTNHTQKASDNEYVYYQGVQGKPGVDFPVLSRIPKTSFTCKEIDSGYYADLETDCQVFHICEDGKKISFLCPNGTIFDQGELICEWWFKVNCTWAPNLYEESAEHLREENAKRKMSRRVQNYGAVMRREERLSVSTTLQKNHASAYRNQEEETSRKPVRQKKIKAVTVKVIPRATTETTTRKEVSFYEEYKPPPTSSILQEYNVSTIRPLARNDLGSNDSDESQILEETASFYKNSFNRIKQENKPSTQSNHRESYSALKEPKYYTNKLSSLSSVTPQYLTTQPFNNGKPFVGIQIGTTLQATPTTIFNVGNTDNPISSFPVSTLSVAPLTTSIPIPPEGSLNLGKTSTAPTTTTRKAQNYAAVYGTFAKNPATTPSTRKTILLSKSLFGTTPSPTSSAEILSASDTINGRTPQVRFFGKVESSTKKSTGFYVTKKADKPRPFELPADFSTKFQAVYTSKLATPKPTYPTYKISSASPFSAQSTPPPTEPTPFTTAKPTLPSTFENVDSMITALAEMANQSPRPGLIIPPSAGPQTLHTLAQYFANALDGISGAKEEEGKEEVSEEELQKKRLTSLLTKMTMDRYNELFNDGTTTTVPDDLEAQHSKSPVESPKVRQLAKVFTQALSSYLDDPATFKRVLEEVRPTEPPNLDPEDSTDSDDELLNFSDADVKSNHPSSFYPTPSAARPTWGYVLAHNGIGNDNENLQGADSQSLVSQLNKLQTLAKESTTKSSIPLPEDHWTTSPNANKLWKTAFSFDPASINENFGTTEPGTTTTTTESDYLTSLPLPEEENREIKYELRALPQLELNSTQVHGILIDFMNTTKLEEDNRLHRILRRLNTTEDEFLTKMKEIERNPLTRRLVLLLISECGTKSRNQELLQASSSIAGARANQPDEENKKSSNAFQTLVDPELDNDNQDARALQLLNSLYTIASRFGK